MTIRKILIANRGEIACRVIRSAHQLGIQTVAVYSDADRDAMHVAMAGQAVHIGPAPAAKSYLLADVIINAALTTGADAIHPGYGFLSENPAFVEAVNAAGLTFIGPSADAIRAMGLKDQAKVLMEKAGVPVVPGYHGSEQDPAFLAQRADEIGYPVLIKARAGGGGKGMRRVDEPANFETALSAAQREGKASFGDASCLVEKYVAKPRHIEVQVFGDSQGNVVHLFERDCSLQRRHQKVIEEAPAPGMTQSMRDAMGNAAVRAAKAVNYQGAGTVEFIVDGSGELSVDGFWFMEMNTRLQVEHPVTEAICKLDLVALQISVAQGKPLPFEQGDLKIHGHAFEARLYAENPAAGFLPATGTLHQLSFPADSSVRIDTGIGQGDAISPHYDPMIAKIITHGPDRASALRQLRQALAQTVTSGSITNREFLFQLAGDADFSAGIVDTGLIERKQTELTTKPPIQAIDYALAALTVMLPLQPDNNSLSNFRLFGAARQSVNFDGEDNPVVTVETARNGQRVCITPLGSVSLASCERSGNQLTVVHEGTQIQVLGFQHEETIIVQHEGVEQVWQLRQSGAHTETGDGNAVNAPMPGQVTQVNAAVGDAVRQGQVLLVMEAMKMEYSLESPRDGVVAQVNCAVADQVDEGAILLALEEAA